MKKIIALVLALGILLFGAGCTGEGSSSAQDQGQKLTEQAYEQQSKAVPYPVEQLKDSLERKNIKEKLLRTNKPDAQGFVYVMAGASGKIVGYYTVKGKVTSNQSQMTADEIVVDRYEGDVVVSAPGDDGSYGENEPGIFFFTTEGAMVTTSLDYIWSDKAIPVDVPRLG
jgi:hypothetical protein